MPWNEWHVWCCFCPSSSFPDSFPDFLSGATPLPAQSFVRWNCQKQPPPTIYFSPVVELPRSWRCGWRFLFVARWSRFRSCVDVGDAAVLPTHGTTWSLPPTAPVAAPRWPAIAFVRPPIDGTGRSIPPIDGCFRYWTCSSCYSYCRVLYRHGQRVVRGGVRRRTFGRTVLVLVRVRGLPAKRRGTGKKHGQTRRPVHWARVRLPIHPPKTATIGWVFSRGLHRVATDCPRNPDLC